MRYTHYDEHKKRWQINDDYGAMMIDELNYAVGEAVDKLAAYEDAEDQGRLVILPCAVGDAVYYLNPFDEWEHSSAVAIPEPKTIWRSMTSRLGKRLKYSPAKKPR